MNKKINSKEENSSDRGFYILLGSCLAVFVLSVYLIISNIGANQETLKNPHDMMPAPDNNIPVAVVTTQKPAEPPKSVASAKPAISDKAETFNLLPSKKQTFAMPLKGELQKKFSVDTLLYSQSMGDWRTHSGIDTKAGVDTPVTAIGDGVVESIYTDPFMGITIVISHNGNIKSIYRNLSVDSMVKVGDKVTGKTVISGVGASAACENLDPPHLHLEITKDEAFIDPEAFLKN